MSFTQNDPLSSAGGFQDDQEDAMYASAVGSDANAASASTSRTSALPPTEMTASSYTGYGLPKTTVVTQPTSLADNKPAYKPYNSNTDEFGSDAQASSSSAAHYPSTVSYSKSSDMKDTHVTLSHPQKHGEGIKNAYVSYQVNIQTSNLARYKAKEFQVQRRYGDFASLHEYLSKEFPFVVMPPLPSKHRLEYLDRFSDEFIGRRQSALERFINRVLAHPVLCDSALVKKFLEEEFWTPAAYVKAETKEGMIEHLSDALMNAFSKVKKPDDRFTGVEKQIIIYEDNMMAIEKYAQRLMHCYHELVSDETTFSAIFSEFALHEANQNHYLNHFSQGCAADATILKRHVEKEEQVFIGYVHEQLGYCHSVKTALKARDQSQIDYESLVDYLNQQSREYERLLNPNSRGSNTNIASFIRGKYDEIRSGDAEQARQDRIGKLEQKIAELRKNVELSHEIHVNFSEQLLKELTQFQNAKQEEVQDMLVATAQHHVEFFRNATTTYDKLIELLQK